MTGVSGMPVVGSGPREHLAPLGSKPGRGTLPQSLVLAGGGRRLRLRPARCRARKGGAGTRKTDRGDCAWLAKVAERGVEARWFIPPEEIRRLCTLTHYRHLTEECSREKQKGGEAPRRRPRQALDRGPGPARGVLRDIMDALSEGNRDPKAPTQRVRGRMRGKVAVLEEALDGADTFTHNHASCCASCSRTSTARAPGRQAKRAQVEELIAAFEHQVAQLDGVNRRRPRRRPGPHRRDDGGHGRVPHRRARGVLGARD